MSRAVRRRTLVFGALGLLVTLVAAAFVFAPGLVSESPLSSVVDATAEADSEQVLLGVAAVVGLAALWAARNRVVTESDDAFGSLTDTPPEAVVVEDDAVAGRRLDEQFAAAIVDGGCREAEAVSTLRVTAIDVLSLQTTESAARQAVEQGTWTDDHLAAAMLAGDDGPRPSLWARLRKWLDPVDERERRLRRTVRAIEGAIEDEATTGGRR